MKIILIVLVIFTAFFMAIGYHDEIDWLYHYIARCELRIEALESKLKENEK